MTVGLAKWEVIPHTLYEILLDTLLEANEYSNLNCCKTVWMDYILGKVG